MAPRNFFVSLFLGVLPLVAAWSEVIPGPGMPSLDSLNLTSEQLFNMPFEPSTVDLAAFGLEKPATDFDSVCLDQTRYGADTADVMACYAYLNNANMNCQVQGGHLYKQVICTTNTATIIGQNIGIAPGGTSSSCDYVAFAVSWAITSCTKNVPALNNALLISGSCAAYGNGALRVDTVSVGSE